MSDTFESISFRDESGLGHEWRDQANCKGLDPEFFHTVRGESTKEALAVCAGCLVVEQCLQYALANSIKVGIWGNTTERQRRKIRRENAIRNKG